MSLRNAYSEVLAPRDVLSLIWKQGLPMEPGEDEAGLRGSGGPGPV